MTAQAQERCGWSDLLKDECGHCQGTPNLWEGPTDAGEMPEQIEGTWTIAAYDSECGCGCNRRIGQGDEITMAKVGDAEVWVLLDHSRKPWVQP